MRLLSHWTLMNIFNKNKKEENKEMYSLGIWSKDEKETLMLLKSQYGGDYEEIRKILNETYGNDRTIGAVRTRLSILSNKQRKEVNKMPIGVYKRKPKDEGKENVFHHVTENIKERVKGGLIDKEIADKWIPQIESLGESFGRDLDEVWKRKNKPIRKSWALHVKDKIEKVDEIEKLLNEQIGQWKIKFPEAKITLSFYGKD